MTPINSLGIEELELKCTDLLSKTYIELGQNPAEETITVMSKILTEDLKRIYIKLFFEDAIEAFRIGVREPVRDFIHLNVPTYIKWLKQHRQRLLEARAEVGRGADPLQIPYYRPDPKLLNQQ